MEYLKSENIKNIIMKSWRMSKKNNVLSSFDKSLVKVKSDKLKLIKKNQKLITVFKSSVQSILKSIKNEYIFILTDLELIVLEFTKVDISMMKILELGMSLSEKSVGTNAISLAKNTNKAVYIKPRDHYAAFLKEWYCFALPLRIDKEIIGYLDVSTVNKELKAEIIQVVDFLANNIIKAYKRFCVRDDIELSEKQREVLKYIVKDMTDYEIARELDCSISNLKKHKINLRKKLGVQSDKGILCKVLKLGILDLNEI